MMGGWKGELVSGMVIGRRRMVDVNLWLEGI